MYQLVYVISKLLFDHSSICCSPWKDKILSISEVHSLGFTLSLIAESIHLNLRPTERFVHATMQCIHVFHATMQHNSMHPHFHTSMQYNRIFQHNNSVRKLLKRDPSHLFQLPKGGIIIKILVTCNLYHSKSFAFVTLQTILASHSHSSLCKLF